MQKIPQTQIEKISSLRKHGYSFPEISAALSVPKTTVFRYAQKVPIQARYLPRWLERRNSSKIISDKQWADAETKAINLIYETSNKELAMFGAALYWAEGSKKDFSFSNTDPAMIKVFLNILRKIYKVADENIKISVRIYEDLNRSACLRFWTGITGIKLGKHTSINILKGSKKGKLRYGMCRVRVKKGGMLLKELCAINNRVINLV
ncbi:hypothetical protein HYT01_02660 [Candidatus Giovannonibacteria bacterium]|nr:hypothetical protein [Candidatus Giovannonibacteria bacterium]